MGCLWGTEKLLSHGSTSTGETWRRKTPLFSSWYIISQASASQHRGLTRPPPSARDREVEGWESRERLVQSWEQEALRVEKGSLEGELERMKAGGGKP